MHQFFALRASDGQTAPYRLSSGPNRISSLNFAKVKKSAGPEVSRCSPNSLKGKGNFIAESPLLYLPMTALW
jgi:hypothetical protein